MQNRRAIPKSVNYTHGHTQLVGPLLLQTDSGGYLWTSTHFIFIPTTDSSDACFSHKQGAAGETIKPVRMSKLCQDCQNMSKSKWTKVGGFNRCLLVLLVVLGAPSLCHEAFGQLLKVPGVFHLNLWLLSEEILKVLQQLDPHVCLLVQTFLLLHQLGPDLWRDTSAQTG